MAGLHGNRGAKRAREARDELGLGQDGPLEDVLAVIEERAAAHVLILALPDDVAGAYIKRTDMPLLIVSGTDPPVRQRFTLAHEFGHFRMQHDAVVDKQETIGRWSSDSREVEANAFAAEFLVPKRAIKVWAAGRPRRAKVTLEDVVTLACAYGVSAIMMRYRLNTCGVLRDEALAAKLDAEIAGEVHLEAVAHLGLEHRVDALTEARDALPRIPKAIRSSQLGDLLAGDTDLAGAAGRLGITVDQARVALETMGIDQLLPSSR